MDFYDLREAIEHCCPTSNIEVERMKDNTGSIATIDGNEIEVFDHELFDCFYEKDVHQLIESKIQEG